MPAVRITLIGAGTIGLSFAALHLGTLEEAELVIYDTRPDIERYIHETLPGYFGGSSSGKDTVSSFISSGRLRIISQLDDAVRNSHIVQEQGPENVPFKQKLWPEIEKHAPPECLFWSSTSGIPASVQSVDMRSPSRLLVVHPYNPPHLMPLIEIVPSPITEARLVEETVEFWKKLGRQPVVLKKEVTGFVANRLAFALLREAVHLVNEGVVSAQELDEVVESSMGPRWAVTGPFKSYHMGGGAGGMGGLLKNIGGTIQACWDDAGMLKMGDGWEKTILQQTTEAYGDVKRDDLEKRDEMTKQVLSAKSRVRARDGSER
ncbi:hypothetical protein M430DRAFT_42513 [Amorphotheca resinae ATCC 22711]|uniref:3-hydroxyacyl-CoA dehydrogenase NAD binding domain-containing protein n=1 Tax=Amorphotheca resinae ATCC 22711 TaxID=857342 RepID=A0A2T3AZB4_AMORE|nr:hypothetical protein M430DRAFT_42513 [Amorphotheca resinae ATCC 22711]PSS16495.1 hypothetical protein M430DRAFT_42513 [Amorphotheca resinae ATCC 22711]